nr:hypothetical protein L204_00771 [Cryptococcus depauperatus CBS 7855]
MGSTASFMRGKISPETEEKEQGTMKHKTSNPSPPPSWSSTKAAPFPQLTVPREALLPRTHQSSAIDVPEQPFPTTITGGSHISKLRAAALQSSRAKPLNPPLESSAKSTLPFQKKHIVSHSKMAKQSLLSERIGKTKPSLAERIGKVKTLSNPDDREEGELSEDEEEPSIPEADMTRRISGNRITPVQAAFNEIRYKSHQRPPPGNFSSNRLDRQHPPPLHSSLQEIFPRQMVPNSPRIPTPPSHVRPPTPPLPMVVRSPPFPPTDNPLSTMSPKTPSLAWEESAQVTTPPHSPSLLVFRPRSPYKSPPIHEESQYPLGLREPEESSDYERKPHARIFEEASIDVANSTEFPIRPFTPDVASDSHGVTKQDKLEIDEPTPFVTNSTELSPEEERDYMDIIRNLIFEGVTPQDLLERGAAEKYVMAVCEEIVRGTHEHTNAQGGAQYVELDSSTLEPEVAQAVQEQLRETRTPSSEMMVEEQTMEAIGGPETPPMQVADGTESEPIYVPSSSVQTLMSNDSPTRMLSPPSLQAPSTPALPPPPLPELASPVSLLAEPAPRPAGLPARPANSIHSCESVPTTQSAGLPGLHDLSSVTAPDIVATCTQPDERDLFTPPVSTVLPASTSRVVLDQTSLKKPKKKNGRKKGNHADSSAKAQAGYGTFVGPSQLAQSTQSLSYPLPQPPAQFQSRSLTKKERKAQAQAQAKAEAETKGRSNTETEVRMHVQAQIQAMAPADSLSNVGMYPPHMLPVSQVPSQYEKPSISSISMPGIVNTNLKTVATSKQEPQLQQQPPPPPTAAPPLPLGPPPDNKALLLARKKMVLESMKRRRENTAKLEAPVSIVKPNLGSMVQDEMSDAVIDIQENPQAMLEDNMKVDIRDDRLIQEEAAALEREMMSLQAKRDVVHVSESDVDADMDIDEPEEGEIILSPPVSSRIIPEPVSASVSRSNTPLMQSGQLDGSLPIRRGVKRAHAEDLMDSRATSAPVSRLPQPPIQRPFGVPLKPHRLVLFLDDPDSSDEEDEEVSHKKEEKRKAEELSRMVEEEAKRKMAEEKQKQLDENILRLKAEIAMKKRRKLGNGTVNGESKATSGSSTPLGISTGELKEKNEAQSERCVDAVMSAVVTKAVSQDKFKQHIVRQSTPADLKELTEELAEAEAQKELHAEVIQADVIGLPTGKVIAGRLVSGSTSREYTNPQQRPAMSKSLELTFSIYRPFLPQYPQLLHAVLDSTFQTINPATGPSAVLLETSDTSSSLDYNLLRSIVLTNRSQTNPDVVLCRAETSGGVCADKNCQDLHIAKGFTPSGK